jgi:RNA polymerase sigma-70 factor (ECF subfamily)
LIFGFSGEEIANQLGLNKNTVMTRLFRARNQLKEALEKQNEQRGRVNG